MSLEILIHTLHCLPLFTCSSWVLTIPSLNFCPPFFYPPFWEHTGLCLRRRLLPNHYFMSHFCSCRDMTRDPHDLGDTQWRETKDRSRVRFSDTIKMIKEVPLPGVLADWSRCPYQILMFLSDSDVLLISSSNSDVFIKFWCPHQILMFPLIFYQILMCLCIYLVFSHASYHSI